jgi:hypothetical protein
VVMRYEPRFPFVHFALSFSPLYKGGAALFSCVHSSSFGALTLCTLLFHWLYLSLHFVRDVDMLSDLLSIIHIKAVDMLPSPLSLSETLTCWAFASATTSRISSSIFTLTILTLCTLLSLFVRDVDVLDFRQCDYFSTERLKEASRLIESIQCTTVVAMLGVCVCVCVCVCVRGGGDGGGGGGM